MSFFKEPTDAQLAIVRAEVGEDSNKLQHNLQLLQKWISCQPHLPQDYDNNILSVFLRGCKHNLERTKKKIEMYFIARTKVPELFCDREISRELLETYNKMMKIALLPDLTPDGHRVTIYKIGENSDDWDTRDVFRCIYITADIRVAEEVPIAGDIFIYDLEHLKAGHVIKYITPIAKKGILAANDAYPQRLQRIHFVNVSTVADKILSFTKTCLKEKMRNRFVLHSKVDDLLNYLPSSLLPTEYGGTNGKFEDAVNNWTDCILKHKKWFQQQDTLKAVEPFPVSYSQFDDVSGVQGSFRQLGID